MEELEGFVATLTDDPEVVNFFGAVAAVAARPNELSLPGRLEVGSSAPRNTSWEAQRSPRDPQRVPRAARSSATGTLVAVFEVGSR